MTKPMKFTHNSKMRPTVIFEGGGMFRRTINYGGTVWEVHSPHLLSASTLRFIERQIVRAMGAQKPAPKVQP
jgi:hypothetical protein